MVETADSIDWDVVERSSSLEEAIQSIPGKRIIESLGLGEVIKTMDPQLLVQDLGLRRTIEGLGLYCIMEAIGLKRALELAGPGRVLKTVFPDVAFYLTYCVPREELLEALLESALKNSGGKTPKEQGPSAPGTPAP